MVIPKVKIKICGITNLEDARCAVRSGAHALGFVFYKKSPRYISPGRAREIIKSLPKSVLKVGVFVNAREKTIKDIAKSCSLDLLQFHGSEALDFCKKFRTYKIIKAFRIKRGINLEDILKYKTFAYLFDTFSKAKAGGTGKKFNWQLLKAIKSDIKKSLFLSGGLSVDNIREAIEIVRPDWVDVSSSLEIIPGKKSGKKINEFIDTVRRI